MVPEPSPSRRQILAGAAGLVGLTGAGTLAVGATDPTALPDAVTDEATRQYPTPPEVTDLWRPTVTESHARWAVMLLARTVDDAEESWERIDTNRHFSGDGGWLDDARDELEAGNYPTALFYATYGMQFAGEDLGYARAKLGESAVDPETLAARGNNLLERAERVAESLKPYPMSDPGRDLAWYYEIEKRLTLARIEFWWEGMETAREGGEFETAYDARDIGEITAGLLRGSIWLRDAEEFHARHAELLSDPRPNYQGHLRRVTESFKREIETGPTYRAMFDRHVAESTDSNPMEFAMARLVDRCFDDSYFGGWEGDPLLAYQVVERSKHVARRRAFDFATDALVVDEGDTDFDSGHVLAEKRRGRTAYREVVGDDPPAVLTRQVSRAVEDLQVAEVGFAGHYREPMWKERLNAYLYALVGRAKLREYPALHRELVGGT